MYDSRRHSTIKNIKILRWRLNLAEYDYEIIDLAGKDKTPVDALSRAYCASMTENALTTIHTNLCHPDMTRLYQNVKAKNLPYSLTEVRETAARCRIFAEIKPRFLKSLNSLLIRATQLFERLNINFKTLFLQRPKISMFLLLRINSLDSICFCMLQHVVFKSIVCVIWYAIVHTI